MKPTAKQKAMSEAAFQKIVIDLARLYGWRVAHFRPAQVRAGRWATPVSADGAGFPDLVMIRGEDLIFAELKALYRKPSPEQQEWLKALTRIEGEGEWRRIHVHVWNERDLEQIKEVLSR